jgi:hypothetical protein
VLREIAWRLREIGNDGRICDLIDSQVTVIEKGTDQFSSGEAKAALRAAFAALQGRLVEFGDDDRPLAPVAETEAAAPFPAAPEWTPTAETVEAILAQEAAEAPSASRVMPAEAAFAAAEAVLTQPETSQPETSPPAEETAAEEAAVEQAAVQNAAPQDADAQDEAVLDMIAMEMGAPDPISDDEIAEAIAEQAPPAEPAPIVPVIIATAPEPVAAPAPPPVQQVIQPPPPPPAAAPAPAPAMPVPVVEMSLGSSLIASGMLRKPVTAANDPLAPIRRMSQVEKIAFFS